MKIELTSEAKRQLERQHRTERDNRARDRIKAVLLNAEGWSLIQIAQALRIHEETVRTHLETKESAKKHGIVLHFLPPYIPNLNPIERLWKVMNEKVRNNVAFKSFEEFKEAVMNFFWVTWKAISQDMVSRINDNFQSFSPASSR